MNRKVTVFFVTCLIACYPSTVIFPQFIGTAHYKSWSLKSGELDTFKTENKVVFSKNRVLLTHSSNLPFQMLFCFDENLVRTLDTVRGINHVLLDLSKESSIPRIVDSTNIGGMLCYHYHLDSRQELDPLNVVTITDFWVTPFVKVDYSVLGGYYNQYLNGTGLLLIKMRQKIEMDGFSTSIKETNFSSLETSVLKDDDLKLKAKQF